MTAMAEQNLAGSLAGFSTGNAGTGNASPRLGLRQINAHTVRDPEYRASEPSVGGWDEPGFAPHSLINLAK